MHIQTTFDNVQAALIVEFAKAYIPSRISLGAGNVIQVGNINLLQENFVNSLQIAYEGTVSLADWGGANWRRAWLMGLGIFVETSQDVIGRNTQAAKDLIIIAKACSEVLHLYDDFTDTIGDGVTNSTAVSIMQSFESASTLLSINNHEYLHVKQQYQVLGPIYNHNDFKGLN